MTINVSSCNLFNIKCISTTDTNRRIPRKKSSFFSASANNVPTESPALAVKYWYCYVSGRLKLLPRVARV